MAAHWITVKNIKDVQEVEDNYYVAPGEFGMPDDFPAMGFLHPDFHESQCIEWQSIRQLQKKLDLLLSIKEEQEKC